MRYNKILRFSFILVILIGILLISNGCKKKEPVVISFSINELTDMYVGEVKTLSITSTSDIADDIIWSVNDNSIAAIDGNQLELLKKGELVITATYSKDESITDSVSYTVTVLKPESLEIIVDETQIYMGDTIDINVNIYPEKANQEFTWTILDNQEYWDVVTIEGNKLTANKYGMVYLTAVAKGNYSASATVAIEVLHPLLEDEAYEVKHIKGALGEDASSEFCIQYSAYNTKTYALVTTEDDPEFLNATKYEGTGRYFEEELANGDIFFDGRNVWRINIDGLQADTKYIYKINKGNDTYSDVYHFRTAGGDSSTTFLFTTDTHYYTGTANQDKNASAAVSETIIDEALKYNPNISFIVDGGDLVDTGGNQAIWDIYFEKAESLKKLPFIGIPGNHEYYHDYRSGDNTYFKLYNANPLNGPEESRGATCWFKHNDTLFIMVDIVSSKGYDERMEWIQNLLETQEYKYSIFVMHYPLHNDNTDYDGKFIDLYDKYNVDLVLTGHYHSQTLREYYYNGAPTTDPYLGTCYLTGAYSGIKGASSPSDAINTSRGYIIDVTDEAINIQIIYANGKLGSKWSITNRECTEEYETTLDDLLASVDMTYSAETNSVKVSWDKAAFGNAKKIYVTELNRKVLSNFAVLPSSSYTSLTINDVVTGFDYNFEVKIVMEDGSIGTVYKTLELHKPLNLQVDSTSDSATIKFDPLEGSMRYQIYKMKIYVNGEFVSEFKYLQNSKDITEYTINNLEPGKSYTIEIVASDRNDREIYFSEQIEVSTK